MSWDNAFGRIEPKWRQILCRDNVFDRVEPKWCQIPFGVASCYSVGCCVVVGVVVLLL
jgi:hypothetical protein